MLAKKKTIYGAVGLLVFLVVILLGLGIYDYVEFRKVAKAASTMPWQFGGNVTFYQPYCQADPDTGVCPNCVECNGLVGNYACEFHEEIQFTPATGSRPPNIACPLKGFVYTGGHRPMVGGPMLGGGASPVALWIAAVPSGSVASKIDKISTWFLAGFRD